MTDFESDDPKIGMRNHFVMLDKAFGKNVYNDFMLAHGVAYLPGLNTFMGARQERHNCFGNALHTALDTGLTYVEGKVFVYGVPLDHAWLIDSEANVIDPTVEDKGQIVGYFGVPFKLDYVKRAVLLNDCYGVLDYFYARKTAPKLFELGLEAGQQWLLDMPQNKKVRRMRRVRA